jgi:hypothetical protein
MNVSKSQILYNIVNYRGDEYENAGIYINRFYDGVIQNIMGRHANAELFMGRHDYYRAGRGRV